MEEKNDKEWEDLHVEIEKSLMIRVSLNWNCLVHKGFFALDY